jgi:hypothetical protein
MNSLEELNQFSQGNIEFGDLRAPGVVFNPTTGVNQTINIFEGEVHAVPVGFEIAEIINYQSLNLYLEIQINGGVAANVDWPTLPGHMTELPQVGLLFAVGAITNLSDWDLIKSPTITLPNDYAGTFTYTVRVRRQGEVVIQYTVTVVVTAVNLFEVPYTVGDWYAIPGIREGTFENTNTLPGFFKFVRGVDDTLTRTLTVDSWTNPLPAWRTFFPPFYRLGYGGLWSGRYVTTNRTIDANGVITVTNNTNIYPTDYALRQTKIDYGTEVGVYTTAAFNGDYRQSNLVPDFLTTMPQYPSIPYPLVEDAGNQAGVTYTVQFTFENAQAILNAVPTATSAQGGVSNFVFETLATGPNTKRITMSGTLSQIKKTLGRREPGWYIQLNPFYTEGSPLYEKYIFSLKYDDPGIKFTTQLWPNCQDIIATYTVTSSLGQTETIANRTIQFLHDPYFGTKIGQNIGLVSESGGPRVLPTGVATTVTGVLGIQFKFWVNNSQKNNTYSAVPNSIVDHLKTTTMRVNVRSEPANAVTSFQLPPNLPVFADAFRKRFEKISTARTLNYETLRAGGNPINNGPISQQLRLITQTSATSQIPGSHRVTNGILPLIPGAESESIRTKRSKALWKTGKTGAFKNIDINQSGSSWCLGGGDFTQPIVVFNKLGTGWTNVYIENPRSPDSSVVWGHKVAMNDTGDIIVATSVKSDGLSSMGSANPAIPYVSNRIYTYKKNVGVWQQLNYIDITPQLPFIPIEYPVKTDSTGTNTYSVIKIEKTAGEIVIVLNVPGLLPNPPGTSPSWASTPGGGQTTQNGSPNYGPVGTVVRFRNVSGMTQLNNQLFLIKEVKQSNQLPYGYRFTLKTLTGQDLSPLAFGNWTSGGEMDVLDTDYVMYYGEDISISKNGQYLAATVYVRQPVTLNSSANKQYCLIYKFVNNNWIYQQILTLTSDFVNYGGAHCVELNAFGSVLVCAGMGYVHVFRRGNLETWTRQHTHYDATANYGHKAKISRDGNTIFVSSPNNLKIWKFSGFTQNYELFQTITTPVLNFDINGEGTRIITLSEQTWSVYEVIANGSYGNEVVSNAATTWSSSYTLKPYLLAVNDNSDTIIAVGGGGNGMINQSELGNRSTVSIDAHPTHTIFYPDLPKYASIVNGSDPIAGNFFVNDTSIREQFVFNNSAAGFHMNFTEINSQIALGGSEGFNLIGTADQLNGVLGGVIFTTNANYVGDFNIVLEWSDLNQIALEPTNIIRTLLFRILP